MEKSCIAVYFILLALTGTMYIKSVVGDLKNCSGSRYTFNQSNGNKYSWSKSKKLCERFGYNLVSIENREEWNFLNQTIQTMKTEEYFIGLRKDTTGMWRWLSDNSTVDASEKGKWPWASDEPNDGKLKENCALMYKYYRERYGGYNNVECSSTNKMAGFICECEDGEGQKSANVTASTMKEKKLAKVTASTRTGITFGNVDAEYPLTDEVHNSKPNLVVIVAVLLAIFILILVIAFGLIFFRRHRSYRKQCKDRVICTYERPLSSVQTSLDPVLVQQTQSSTELTVHLTLSRTESELATYETVSDCKKECEYNNIDDTHRTPRSVSEGCSDVQERERKYTHLVSDVKGLAQPPSLRDENEENNDPVYAVIHKEGKGRASSEVNALKKPSGRPQEKTNGLPVSQASCVGLVDYTKAAMSETLQAGENTEYLYAVVDKTKKKKKPPQMPPPYRSLVYADLIHSQENSAKLVKEQSQTVYTDVYHVKTATVKTSQQNLEETKDGEH